MNRDYYEDGLIELGAASVVTRGSMTPVKDDEEGGWKPAFGLSDD